MWQVKPWDRSKLPLFLFQFATLFFLFCFVFIKYFSSSPRPFSGFHHLFVLRVDKCKYVIFLSDWIVLKPHKNICKHANDLGAWDNNIEPTVGTVWSRIVKGDLISYFQILSLTHTHTHAHSHTATSYSKDLLKWPRNCFRFLLMYKGKNICYGDDTVVQLVKGAACNVGISNGCSTFDPVPNNALRKGANVPNPWAPALAFSGWSSWLLVSVSVWPKWALVTIWRRSQGTVDLFIFPSDACSLSLCLCLTLPFK